MTDLKLLVREGADADASFALPRENLCFKLPRMDSLRSMVDDRRTECDVCAQLSWSRWKTVEVVILQSLNKRKGHAGKHGKRQWIEKL